MHKNLIKNEIVDTLGQETFYYTKEYGQKIRGQIEQWLKKKKQLNTRLHNYYKKALQLEHSLGRVSNKGTKIDLSSGNLHNLYREYAEANRHIKDLKTLEDIKNFYQEGYRLIHKIREDITGQDITYNILFQDNEKLMEAHLTLDQVLSMTSLVYSDIKTVKPQTELVNATSLSINNSAVMKYLKENIQKNEKDLGQLIQEIEKPALWDSIVNIKSNANFGVLYEAYTILRRVREYSSINYIGKRQRNLAKTLIKNAKKNNIPGWQAGDIGTEQLKSVFNGAANLMSGSAMEKVLSGTLKAFSQINSEEMKTALKKIYTTQQSVFDNILDEKAEKEAIAAIDKFINGINRT